MTPLACDIQHRHQHGAFGMKTTPSASITFQGGQPGLGAVHIPQASRWPTRSRRTARSPEEAGNPMDRIPLTSGVLGYTRDVV